MTTTASPTLVDYRARLAGLPEQTFIGSVLWFSIAGTVERDTGRAVVAPVRVNSDLLERWFDELGLDKSFLPNRIKKVDAFRSASSQLRREYAEEGGRTVELYADEVKSDPEQVIRHVFKRVRDARREIIQETQVATVKFIRGGRTAKGKRHGGDHVKHAILSRVHGVDHAETEAWLEEFYRKYEDAAVNLNAAAIRSVLRAYLRALHAIPLRSSGGLYFVDRANWPALEGLQVLVKRIGQGCLFDQFPLIDSPASRQTLTEAFEAEVEEETRQLLADIAAVNASSAFGRISPAKYAQVNARYREIADRSERYTDQIGLAAERVGSALTLACEALLGMAEHVG